MKGLQAILGFDMETDIGNYTSAYEGLTKGTPEILHVLDEKQVTSTFFFTGESVRKHPEVVRDVYAAGHEVGTHTLFHETIGEPLYEIPGRTTVLPEEVPNRLRLCTELVEEATGERPVSFRAPCLFGSTAMVNALDALGYVADATYPMFYFRERLRPYHPNRDDWTQEGDLSIVELPNFADLTTESKDPYGRDMDQWPLFRISGANALMEHIDRYIHYCGERGVEPFLCFYFHPWEFYPMPQGEIALAGEGYVRPNPFIVENCGPYAVEQLGLLIDLLTNRGAEFLQARQAAARFA